MEKSFQESKIQLETELRHDEMNKQCIERFLFE